MPVSFDADGNPSYPAWDQTKLDALLGLFVAFDPENKGLDRAWLKQMNRGVGTNDLQMGIEGLIASGKLESRLITAPSAKVAIETFFRKV